jgi:hypothetical protein
MRMNFINMIIAGHTSVSGYRQKYTFYNVVHREPNVQCQMSSVLIGQHSCNLLLYFFFT